MSYKQYSIYITVFSTGAVVMVLELLGTRILAPYLGLSLYVWTSIIGVILAALSIGYALGGRLADKNPSFTVLRRIILASGIVLAVLSILKDIIPELLVKLGPLLGSLLASAILFLPGSLLLAMVSPYAIKLKLQSIEKTGRTAGDLYAFSTAGSIVGTFVAGYVLIPNFQTSTILIAMSVILLATAALNKSRTFRRGIKPRRKDLLPPFISAAEPREYSGKVRDKPPKISSAVKITILIVAIGFLSQKIEGAKNVIASIPSAYAQISIVDHTFNGRDARLLLTDHEVESGIYLDSDELVFDYTKFFNLDEYFRPNPKRALLLGGGAYSIARDFLRRYPESSIEVVEIDPKITAIARQYFNLADMPGLKIFHEDGRVFINRKQGAYDIIYNDTFRSYYAIPYQLTTREAVRAMYDNLAEDGVVIVNVISTIDGPMSDFFKAEYKTFQSVFPGVRAFAVDSPNDLERVQNIVLVGLKHKNFAPPQDNEIKDDIRKYLANEIWPKIPASTPILIDEFAPVDYYIAKLKVGR